MPDEPQYVFEKLYHANPAVDVLFDAIRARKPASRAETAAIVEQHHFGSRVGLNLVAVYDRTTKEHLANVSHNQLPDFN